MIEYHGTTTRTKKEIKINNIIQATTQTGEHGHPVIFPLSVFEQLKSLSGDQGARGVIKRNKNLLRLVALPYLHARTDLDTPEEWQDWLSRQNKPPEA